MTLTDLKTSWQDTPEYHTHIHELFCENVNNNPDLKEHRDWVQNNIFGFGERSFWWLWKLVCDELPKEPMMLEIGIFKGATISLWQKLRKDALAWGISPMNGDGTGWTDDDYWAHLNTIYDKFNSDLPPTLFPIIIQGYSTDEQIINSDNREYDLIYVDGGHSYETALSDLVNYSPKIKQGGYLVIDDCNCELNFPPTGFFTGIDTVTEAKKMWLQQDGDNWEFICSVVHISVFQRK